MSETIGGVSAEALAEFEILRGPEDAQPRQNVPEEATETVTSDAKPDGEAKPDGDKSPDAEEKPEGEDDPKAPRWYRQQLKRMQEELRQLRAMAQPAQQQPQAPQQSAPKIDVTPFIGPRPDPSKYDGGLYDPEYSADLGAYKVKEELTRAQIAHYQRQMASAETAKVEEFRSREAAFAESVPDYEDVARNPSLAITQNMADVISELENGPAVAYWLGKNPKEAERISGLSPRRQAAEIGRIEARLEAAREAPRNPATAPPPVPQVRARGAAGNALSPSLSMEAWAENYRKSREAWRK